MTVTDARYDDGSSRGLPVRRWCQSNMTALLGEVALFVPGCECDFPVAQSGLDSLISGYNLTQTTSWGDLSCSRFWPYYVFVADLGSSFELVPNTRSDISRACFHSFFRTICTYRRPWHSFVGFLPLSVFVKIKTEVFGRS